MLLPLSLLPLQLLLPCTATITAIVAVGTTALPPLLLPLQISPPFFPACPRGTHVCSKDNGLGHMMNLMAGIEVWIWTPAATIPDAAVIAASAATPVTAAAAAAAIVTTATIAAIAPPPLALPLPLLL